MSGRIPLSQVAGARLCTPPTIAWFCEVAERGDVALVRLERLQDRTQLEVGARAARRPPVHLRTVRRVAHDRAVRDVEEPHAHLRRRGRLRQRGRRRNHRVEQRQRQRDTGALAARSGGTDVASSGTWSVLLPWRRSSAEAACMRNASLDDDAGHDGREPVVLRRGAANHRAHLRHVVSTRAPAPPRTSSAFR